MRRSVRMVRYCKILLILAVAFFGFLGIFNFLSWDTGYRMVESVVSMADVPGGSSAFQATDNRIVVTLGVLFIALSKIAGGVFCTIGAVKMLAARNALAIEFNAAKDYALAGCAILIFLFVGGFMYLAGQFFMGWRTEIGASSSEAAFRLAASVAIILIFVNQEDR